MCLGAMDWVDGTLGHTTDHVYSRTEKLGSGASCDVFKGVEKTRNAIHALKIFKSVQWRESKEMIREVGALSHLLHPNIVTLCALEQELGTGKTVLVMEYCSGGSLHAYLNEPENIHGLSDCEFISFLHDVMKGWKHVRRKGYLHRDIKPGNILRHITADGEVVYKLADFGASTSTDTGEFHSLAGTEEYLHPALYEKAFMDGGGGGVFTESADLWSLGVTIYQAGTGEFPFQPPGGCRNNRAGMFELITCKPAGAISGVKRNHNDKVRWSRTMPDTSRLSRWLREEITPTVAGLLESDPGRQLTFLTVEAEINRLVSLKMFHVVNAEDASVHVVYLPKQPSMVVFQEAVAKVTDVAASRQMLLWGGHLLSERDWKLPCGQLTGDEPVVLVTNDEEGEEGELSLRENPDSMPMFGSGLSVEADAKVAFRICSFIYVLFLRILDSVILVKGQCRAQSALVFHLKYLQNNVEKKFKVLSETCKERYARLEMIRELETTWRRRFLAESKSCIWERTRRAKESLAEIHRKLWQLKDNICASRRRLYNHDVFAMYNTECLWPEHFRKSFDESKVILENIRKWKTVTPLQEDEKQLYKAERQRLNLLCRECVNSFARVLKEKRKSHDIFIGNKRKYLLNYNKLMTLENELASTARDSQGLSTSLDEIWVSSVKDWKDNAPSMSHISQQSARDLARDKHGTKPNNDLAQKKHSSESTKHIRQKLDRNIERFELLLEQAPEVEILKLDS